MRITEALIKQWIDDITFKRAKQYYEGNYIEPLQIKQTDIKGFKKVNN